MCVCVYTHAYSIYVYIYSHIFFLVVGNLGVEHSQLRMTSPELTDANMVAPQSNGPAGSFPDGKWPVNRRNWSDKSASAKKREQEAKEMF